MNRQIAAGAFLEVFLAITGIRTAVVLFPVLKRYNEAVALGYGATRIFESTIIAVGIVSVLSLVTLRRDVGGAAAAGSANLVLTGRSLVAIHDWTFLIGPAYAPVSATGCCSDSSCTSRAWCRAAWP